MGPSCNFSNEMNAQLTSLHLIILFIPCSVPYTLMGDPLHNRAACTQPCNVNTHSRAHCSPGARLCEQWGHGCVNNGARMCASARLCRGSPVFLAFHWLTTVGKDMHLNVDVIKLMHLTFETTINVTMVIATAGRLLQRTDMIEWHYYVSLPSGLSAHFFIDK